MGNNVRGIEMNSSQFADCFCAASDPFARAAEDAVRSIFPSLTGSDVRKYYDIFKESFSKEGRNLPVLKKGSIEPDVHLGKEEMFAGIDFPTWFLQGNERVLLLGECPHRSTKNEQTDQVSVGTPYSFHSHAERDKEKNVCWGLVSELLNKGMTVYLTDISKIFGKDYKYWKDDCWNRILMAELGLISPNHVVLLGSRVQSFWDSRGPLCKDANLIRIIHPSRRNFPKCTEEFFGRYGVTPYSEVLGDIVCQEIEKGGGRGTIWSVEQP
jgi:hypothetical protein